MFSQLPNIYEDELLYSILSRYQERSMDIKEINTLKILGLKRIRPLLPANITFFLKEISIFSPPNIDDFLSKHTFFFYYSNFWPEKKTKYYYDHISIQKGSFNKLIGELVDNHIIQNLRYCIKCFNENEITYGESYWHVTPQIPTVFICPKHQTLLNISKVSIVEQSLRTLNSNNCSLEEQVGQLKKMTMFHLRNLTLESLYLNKKNYNLYSCLKNLLYFQLINRKFVKPSGTINVTLFERAFINFFGIELLNFLKFPLNLFKEFEINPFLYHVELTPTQALLLIIFLTNSVQSFLQQQYRFPSRIESSFICTNPDCNHSKACIEDLRLRLINGKLYCSYKCGFCNFEYEIFFDANGWRKLVLKIKESQAFHKAILKDIFLLSKKLDDTSKKFKVSSIFIEKKLLNENADLQLNERFINKNRSLFIKLLKSSKYSLFEVKHSNFSLYAFLYNFDRDWMEKHISKIGRYHSVKDNENWSKRDRKILLHLKDIVSFEILRGNTRVYEWIYREVELLDLHFELPFLKSTSNYINKHCKFHFNLQSFKKEQEALRSYNKENKQVYK